MLLERNPAFMTDLSALLNKHGVDNQLNTPDFILAQHLTLYLAAMRVTMFSRDAWFHAKPPASPKETANGRSDEDNVRTGTTPVSG